MTLYYDGSELCQYGDGLQIVAELSATPTPHQASVIHRELESLAREIRALQFVGCCFSPAAVSAFKIIDRHHVRYPKDRYPMVAATCKFLEVDAWNAANGPPRIYAAGMA